MKLPRRLVGKITQSEWNQIRPARLAPCDRRDIVDVLCALKADTPTRDRREILKMVEGLADDLVTSYCEDNTMTLEELREGRELARSAMKVVGR